MILFEIPTFHFHTLFGESQPYCLLNCSTIPLSVNFLCSDDPGQIDMDKFRLSRYNNDWMISFIPAKIHIVLTEFIVAQWFLWHTFFCVSYLLVWNLNDSEQRKIEYVKPVWNLFGTQLKNTKNIEKRPPKSVSLGPG